MSNRLDILALEPFYGGIRRSMLDLIISRSRHKWTLLKLPPRRIERRLTTASVWFAEQLSRHWIGQTDLLFTSEALNLADLQRALPQLSKKPSVVYFHSNQLPDPSATHDGPLDLINLNTATAATEIWFNSMYHVRVFLARVNALVRRHPELSGMSPVPELTSKATLVAPPINLPQVRAMSSDEKVARGRRTIFVETRDANNRLLNSVMALLKRRGESFQLITVGPVEELMPDLPRITLPEADESSHARALLQSSIFLSTRFDAPCDHYAVRALAAGCWPLCPQMGFYREILPENLHSPCLHDGNVDHLASRLMDVWLMERPQGYESAIESLLEKYDPDAAVNAIDDRLDGLVVSHSMKSE
ncbi:MAG TPA: DUF3524 domain-containing protein [Tepidisphaeraceae bacterium]|nr:DUF3524 domain-containing protein [Tepidisphaeraceae bacterium]